MLAVMIDGFAAIRSNIFDHFDEPLGGRKRGPDRVMGLDWRFMESTHHTAGVLACPALDSNPVSAFYHVIDEYVKLRVQRDFIPCKLHGLLCTHAQRVLLII
jgi:hypothetical protein